MANLAFVKVGQGLTAAILNGIIGRVNGQALTGIIPKTVAGATASQNGQLTFTNTVAVSVGGVFSTDFDNYRLVWNSSTRSAAASIQFRFRSAGVDDTGALYAWIRGQDQGTTRSTTSGTASTAFPIDSPAAAGLRSDGYVDVFSPALGSGSSIMGLATLYDPANGMTQVQTSARDGTQQAFDGFSLFMNSGTITGTLRIYGYNNLV